MKRKLLTKKVKPVEIKPLKDPPGWTFDGAGFIVDGWVYGIKQVGTQLKTIGLCAAKDYK
jgi:hypothetical protein